MTRIVMYKAADGTLFNSLAEKNAYEGKAKVQAAVLKAMAEKKIDLSSSFLPNDYDALMLNSADLPVFIANNADALRKILGSVKVANRGRPAGAKNKPKKPVEVPQNSIPTGVVTHAPTVQ